jgi:hypothetical protein
MTTCLGFERVANARKGTDPYGWQSLGTPAIFLMNF